MAVVERDTAPGTETHGSESSPGEASPPERTLVFMSYSRKDAAFADQLRSALSDRGVDVWVDKQGIHHGEEFGVVIERAIDEATAMLFVITPHSVADDSYCLKELRYAEERHKRLLPVLHADVPKTSPQQVPPSLARLDYTPLRPTDDFNAEVGRLVDAIYRLPAWHQQHARLLIQATQWEHNPDDKSLLLRDRQLRAAENWQSAADGQYQVPTPLELQFIQASERDERLRSRRRMRLISTAAIVALALSAVALTAAVIARQQQERAIQEQNMAVGHSAGASAQLLQRDRSNLLDTSVLLSLEAMKRAASVGAYTVLRSGLSLLPRPLPGGVSGGQVELSPNGEYAAVMRGSGLRVLSTADGRVLSPELAGSSIAGTCSCFFSPDSRYLVTMSGSNTVFVWDSTRNWASALRPFHVQAVPTITFSPDGSYALAMNARGTYTLWLTGSSWRLADQLINSRGALRWPAAVGPEARDVAIEGSSNGSTVPWLFTTSARPRQLSMPANIQLYNLSFDGGGRFLVGYGGCASCRAPTIVWDADKGWSPTVLPTSLSSVDYAVFSPNERYLATAEAEGGTDTLFASGLITVWNTATWKPIKRFHEASPSGLAFSPDGKYLADSTTDGTSSVWAVHRGWQETSRAILRQTGYSPNSLAFTSQDVLVTSGLNGAQRWDISHQWDGIAQNSTEAGAIDTVSSNGRYGLVEPRPGLMRVVDIAAGGKIVSFPYHYTPSPHINLWSAFSSNGTALVVHDGYHPGLTSSTETSSTTWLWRRTAGWRRLSWSPSQQPMAVSPDGRLVFIKSGIRQQAWVDNLADHRIMELPGLVSPSAAAFSPDSRYLAAATSNSIAQTSQIRLWDANHGWRPVRISGAALSGLISGLSFSDDGRFLVALAGQMNDCTPGPNGAVTLWNAHSGRVIKQIALDDTPCAAAFSPDGQYMAVLKQNGTVGIWTTSDWTEVAELDDRLDPGTQVQALTFSSDGRWITTAGTSYPVTASGTLSSRPIHVLQRRYWRPGDLERAACARLTHNLSYSDWEQYLTGERYVSTCPGLPRG